MLDVWLKDLRHSLRGFAKSPSFTVAALAALTLGIGTTTAVFSVVNAVLLEPVAVRDPDRVVLFMNTSPQGAGPAASPAKFAHYRRQGQVVQDVSAFNTGVVNFTGGTTVEQLRSARVSRDFFRLFGAPVALGRTFTADEDLPSGPHAVVLSHRLWTTRFEGKADVVGRTISLGGLPHTIVGVLGEFDFREFGPAPQVFLPFQLAPESSDQGHYFQVAGRLKAGVSLEQAKARLQLSANEFKARYPDALGPNQGFSVQPIGEALVRNVRSSLLVLGGAVSFVLLIACANVANLLLARAAVHPRPAPQHAACRREIALRAAIGSSRGRVVRQLLTESVVLSLGGGALGLVLGWAGIRALLAVNTAGLPRVGENGSLVGIDWRVLAFTLAVSVATGILFGLIPALQSARTDLASTLKEGGGRAGAGFRQNKARSVLVVAEVALALVLLVGSALLIRTAVALGGVDPGFDPRNVLTLRMSLSDPRFGQSEAVEQMVRTTRERLRALPEVVEASATCCVPLQGGYGLPFQIVGRPLTDGPFHGGGGWITLSPGYFEVFRIPLKRGRLFNERDDSRGPAVVIINEAMAREFWPKGTALGERLVIGRGVMKEFADEPEREIVGIVGDSRDGGLNSDPQPVMYIPQAQVPDAANALNVGLTPLAWVVRTRTPPGAASAAIQEELRQATGLPVATVRSMEDVVSLSTSRQRFNMWLMTVFAASALLLAAIGIYGLMAYSVEQRRQEIGLRLALGARPGQVKGMVVRQGMLLALIGVATGTAGAFALSRLINAFLFGVTARDPAVFAGVPLLLATVALLAVWLPARRASSVNATIALRYE